ncbi:MAG: PBECR2 nuclease fold domain-containing protein [Cellulosilyticaceae bacterium]
MGKNINLEENKDVTQTIGEISYEILELLNLAMENNKIFIYPGAIRHIKRRHPYAFKLYFKKIPEVIAYPDYIGMSSQNPKRIELVRCYKDNILVALKLDENYNLFVSSMYIIEENRIEKRVEYGRLQPIKLEGLNIHNREKNRNPPQYARY